MQLRVKAGTIVQLYKLTGPAGIFPFACVLRDVEAYVPKRSAKTHSNGDFMRLQANFGYVNSHFLCCREFLRQQTKCAPHFQDENSNSSTVPKKQQMHICRRRFANLGLLSFDGQSRLTDEFNI
jgi:hypothetical protein